MAETDWQKDVNLLFELGTGRLVDRTWKQYLMPNVANLVEHTFRVQWLALLIAKMEGITDEARLGKIALMALQHDMSELRTGDVAYVSRQYTERHEDMAMEDIFSGTTLSELVLPLWKESSAKESMEAKIVKDADNLDCDLELREMEAAGHQAKRFLVEENRQYVFEQKLYTESAKKLWKSIYSTDPFDWIKHARNRRNAGDWKNKTA
jgi:putative hydrolase of HD superfamily